MYERSEIKEMDWPRNLYAVMGWRESDPLDHISEECEADIALCLSGLTDREKDVIRKRYIRQMTFDDIGKEFGVGKERVRQIEAKAMRKLNHPYNDGGYILRFGIRAYIERRVNKQVDELLEIRTKEMLNQYRQKMVALETESKETIQKTIQDEVMAMEVEELGLSVRAYNCLKRGFCDTVKDIVTKYPTLEEAEKIRNLGRRSMEEISTVLAGYGIKWPKNSEDEE